MVVFSAAAGAAAAAAAALSFFVFFLSFFSDLHIYGAPHSFVFLSFILLLDKWSAYVFFEIFLP